MNLAVISSTIAFAMAGTLVFTALLILGRKLPLILRRRTRFQSSATNNPAEYLRTEWHQLGQRRSLYLTPILFFIVCALTLLLAEPTNSGFDLAGWQQVCVVIVVGIAVAGSLYRGIQYSFRRQQLQFKIEASQTIGHAVRQLTANLNRTFHDVPCALGIVDHVIVGIHGIYAIKVVARRPGKNNTLTLSKQILDFADGRYLVPLTDTGKIADRFARECGKVVQHEVHVRLVIAVPGWDIATQPDDNMLITNERNLAMLTGWKDERDYLLNEDAEALQKHLDELCARTARPDE